jgi:hypothetical protein
VIERVQQDGGLGRPPAVDRRLSDAGSLGNPLDAELRVALLAAQLERGAEDRLRGALVR